MVTVKPRIAFFEIDGDEEKFFRQELKDYPLYLSSNTINNESLQNCQDCELVSIFVRSEANKTVLSQLPNLKLLTTRSTGFDHIDLNFCSQAGIKVANVPAYGGNTVAEHTFALILALSRNLHKAYLKTLKGNFSIKGLQGFDLQGKTLGVIGAGQIGQHVIKIAKGFGMKVLAYDNKQHPFLAEILRFKYVPLEFLLGHSDIITLHTPLVEQTKHLINKNTIKKVKPGALLINTARGELIDTNALINALDEGIIKGAGLDVLEGENYIAEDRELLKEEISEKTMQILMKNRLLLEREDVVVTPHIGFDSLEATRKILETTRDNILGFLKGKPTNLINKKD